MMAADYLYTAQMIGNLSNLPVRVYRETELIETISQTSFKPDPAFSEQDKMLASQALAVFHITDDHICFGLVRAKSDQIAYLIGPSLQFQMTQAQAIQYLHARGEPAARWRELLDYFNSMPHADIRNFAQMICSLCWFVNGTRIYLADLMLPGVLTEILTGDQGGQPTNTVVEQPYHNTFEYEQQILSLVEYGQPERLAEIFAASPNSGIAGKVALDEIRQEKNILIGFSALVSRAAVRGGLPVETAFALVDRYDQQAELLDNLRGLTKLLMSMIIEFARQVKAIRHPASSTKIVRQVIGHVNSHIDQKITTKDVAESLKVERTYLCKRFKHYTGQSINEYVTSMKIDEAKRLLVMTDKTLSAIADYLAFSSQSYFQNVFKKLTGLTPLEYRGHPELFSISPIKN